MSLQEFVRNNLPLHICGISVFAVMIALVFKHNDLSNAA